MNRSNGLFDLITILFVGLTMLICVAVVLMITKAVPVPIAAFRPSTPIVATSAFFPTETITPTLTLTPLPSATDIPSSTSIPTKTHIPTDTPTETPLPTDTLPPSETLPPPTETFTPSEVPTETRTPTSTKTPLPTIDPNLPTKTPKGFPFTIAKNSPAYTANFDTSQGCSFEGIGGQAFGMNKEPLQGLMVHVTSTTGFNQSYQTGGAPQYGQAGFIIQVGSAAAAGVYSVELQSDKGVPLSGKIKVSFPGTCDKNLALINFFQTRPY